jgi:Ca2+-binding RTX toxin-like protein
VIAMLASLALAVTAHAGNIAGSTSSYTYTAGSGEANTISVTTVSPTSIEIVDDTATLTESSSTCTKSGSVVTCSINSSGSTNFAWNLGDQDDYLGPAAPINDTIDGGLGADIMNCGDGQDTIKYTSRTAGVRVTPDDGLSNDGELTEFDTVESACEVSTGSGGPDYLVMSNSATKGVIDGGGGNDYLVGGPGNTSTSCAASTNPTQLLGQAGDDTIINRVGSAYLQGYNGDDLIISGNTCAYIFSGYGSDTVIAGDGGAEVWDLYGSTNDVNVFVGGTGADSIVGSWQGTNTIVVASDDTGDSYTCYSTATDTIVANSWDSHDTGQGDGDAHCDTLIKN